MACRSTGLKSIICLAPYFQDGMWGLTLTTLTQPTSKEEATNGRDGVYQLGSRAYYQRHQRKPFHCDASSFHCDASTLSAFCSSGEQLSIEPQAF